MWRIYIQRDNLYGTNHYSDVIMSTIVSQITSLTFVYSTVYSDTDQRKHQSSAPLALVRGSHREPANFPHKWPVTRKMFPFDDVIMRYWPSGKVTLILTLVQAMSGCHHVTIHYLSQWWLGFVSLFPGRSEFAAMYHQYIPALGCEIFTQGRFHRIHLNGWFNVCRCVYSKICFRTERLQRYTQ